jgi:hypothetical protein
MNSQHIYDVNSKMCDHRCSEFDYFYTDIFMKHFIHVLQRLWRYKLLLLTYEIAIFEIVRWDLPLGPVTQGTVYCLTKSFVIQKLSLYSITLLTRRHIFITEHNAILLSDFMTHNHNILNSVANDSTWTVNLTILSHVRELSSS